MSRTWNLWSKISECPVRDRFRRYINIVNCVSIVSHSNQFTSVREFLQLRSWQVPFGWDFGVQISISYWSICHLKVRPSQLHRPLIYGRPWIYLVIWRVPSGSSSQGRLREDSSEPKPTSNPSVSLLFPGTGTVTEDNLLFVIDTEKRKT